MPWFTQTLSLFLISLWKSMLWVLIRNASYEHQHHMYSCRNKKNSTHNICFRVENPQHIFLCWVPSTYVFVQRRFPWVPTTYVFVEESENYLLDANSYPELYIIKVLKALKWQISWKIHENLIFDKLLMITLRGSINIWVRWTLQYILAQANADERYAFIASFT